LQSDSEEVTVEEETAHDIEVKDDIGNQENPRCRRAISADDFLHILELVSEYDNAALPPDDYRGKLAIVFEKIIDGSLGLFIQTMYAGIKKESRGNVTDDNSPVITSETFVGMAPSDNIVLKAEEVKTVEEQTVEEISIKDDIGNQEHPRGSNYIIHAKGLSLSSREKERFKANNNAIITLRTVMEEGRLAMSSEQDVL
jgi:hypothetical protein